MGAMGGAMTMLAIDTSCDETAAAVTEGPVVLSNVIWSQASQHAKWGGVVPSLAKRLHGERIDWAIDKAMSRSRTAVSDIVAVAVTIGPGLAPALEVGIAKAKELALQWNAPLIPVNHLEGHVASTVAVPRSKIKDQKSNMHVPAVALIVSGGHTELVLIEKTGTYKMLAQTIDDALGEALDKAARMIGLGYPGAAVMEKLARHGNPQKYKLPLPLLGRENQGAFSFSGLKTAFYRLVQKETGDQQTTCDLAASFQATAFHHVVRIVNRHLKDCRIDHFLVGGGVCANTMLRRELRKLGKGLNMSVKFPYSKKLCTDNAAMIGVAAQWAMARGEIARTKEEIDKIDRQPNLNFQ